MLSRRSLLKTLFAAPLAPLLGKFRAANRRVIDIKVVELPTIGYLMTGVEVNPIESINGTMTGIAVCRIEAMQAVSMNDEGLIVPSSRQPS